MIKEESSKMIKISVIIPFFNAENFLPATINSLKKQTLTDIEIILVNDGSTDNSLETCKNLINDDKRFKVISQVNKGVSAARNTGIQNGSGLYYLFLDADDIYDADMCECMYNLAVEDKADLVIFGIKIKEFDGKIRYMNNTNVKETWDKNKALKEFFSGEKINEGITTKLFRSDLIKKIRFEEGKKVNEDKYFLFQSIFLSKKIVYKDQCKYLYIRRKGSASNSSYSSKYKDTIYFSKKILNKIQNDFPKMYLEAYKNLQDSRLFTFRKLCKDKKNKNKFFDDYKELKDEIKNSKLKDSKKCKLLNKLEIIFIKLFGDLYFYIISFVYRNK